MALSTAARRIKSSSTRVTGSTQSRYVAGRSGGSGGSGAAQPETVTFTDVSGKTVSIPTHGKTAEQTIAQHNAPISAAAKGAELEKKYPAGIKPGIQKRYTREYISPARGGTFSGQDYYGGVVSKESAAEQARIRLAERTGRQTYSSTQQKITKRKEAAERLRPLRPGEQLPVYERFEEANQFTRGMEYYEGKSVNWYAPTFTQLLQSKKEEAAVRAGFETYTAHTPTLVTGITGDKQRIQYTKQPYFSTQTIDYLKIKDIREAEAVKIEKTNIKRFLSDAFKPTSEQKKYSEFGFDAYSGIELNKVPEKYRMGIAAGQFIVGTVSSPFGKATYETIRDPMIITARGIKSRYQEYAMKPDVSFGEFFKDWKKAGYQVRTSAGRVISGTALEFAERPIITTAKYYVSYKAFEAGGFLISQGLRKGFGIGVTKATRIASGSIAGGYLTYAVSKEPEKFLKPAGYIETLGGLAVYSTIFKGFKNLDKGFNKEFKLTRYRTTRIEGKDTAYIKQYPDYSLTQIKGKDVVVYKEQARIPFTNKYFTYRKIPFDLKIKGAGTTQMLNYRTGLETGGLEYSFIEKLPKGYKLMSEGPLIKFTTRFNFAGPSVISQIGSGKSLLDYRELIKTGYKKSYKQGGIAIRSFETKPVGEEKRARTSFISFGKKKDVVSKGSLLELSPAGEKWITGKYSLPASPEAKFKLLGKGKLGKFSSGSGKEKPGISISYKLLPSKVLGTKQYKFVLEHERAHFYDISNFGISTKFFSMAKQNRFEIKQPGIYNEANKIFKEYNIRKLYNPTQYSKEIIANFGARYALSPEKTAKEFPKLTRFYEQETGIRPTRLTPFVSGGSTGITDVYRFNKYPDLAFLKETTGYKIKYGPYNIDVTGYARGKAMPGPETGRIDVIGGVKLGIRTQFYEITGAQKTKASIFMKQEGSFSGLKETDTTLRLGKKIDVSLQTVGLKGAQLKNVPEVSRTVFFSYETRGGTKKPLFIGTDYRMSLYTEAYAKGSKERFISIGKFAGGKETFKELGETSLSYKIIGGGQPFQRTTPGIAGPAGVSSVGSNTKIEFKTEIKTEKVSMLSTPEAKQIGKKVGMSLLLKSGITKEVTGTFAAKSKSVFRSISIPKTEVYVGSLNELSQNQSTKLNQRLAQRQSAELSQKLLQNQSTKQSQRLAQRQSTKQSQKLLQRQSTKQSQKLTQRQSLLSVFENVSLPTPNIGAFFALKIPIEPPTIIPRFGNFETYKRKKKGKLYKVKKPKGRYQPSIRAGYSGITGRIPRLLTGFEVRPLI